MQGTEPVGTLQRPCAPTEAVTHLASEGTETAGESVPSPMLNPTTVCGSGAASGAICSTTAAVSSLSVGAATAADTATNNNAIRFIFGSYLALTKTFEVSFPL